MSSRLHVAIVGAGIGGLTAALALLQRGIDVDVYEQAGELREVGAGIQMSANGTRVLDELGLREAIERDAVQATGKEIRLWNSGQAWPLFDLGTQSEARFGYPYLMVHRADLLAALAAGVTARKARAIHLRKRLSGFTQDGSGVTLRFEDGTTAQADALVGADGVHSRVRATLFGADAPVFTGCMAWRGLVPTSDLPANLRRLVGTNWVGPGAHVVHYPVRRGELLNFVGIVERSDWQVESWTTQGTVEECAADFAGWNEEVHAIIRRLDRPNKWALMGRQPLARWSEGAVTLMGDACHPTLPFLAQGAMMAIEDGLVLARCLEAHAGDVPGAFERFQQLRMERTSKIVIGSSENAKRFHAQELSNAAEAQAYVDREWNPQRVEQRYTWLFEYDASRVPVEAGAVA